MLGRTLFTLFLAVFPAAAASAQDRGVFDIALGALDVGVFAYSGVESGGRYSTAGQLRSTGVVGALADVRYEAKSQGSITPRGYVPEVYEERANIGVRSTDLTITYDDGVPRPPEFNPPREPSARGIDPATQGDALDLMTVLYLLLKTQPERDVCALDTPVFDGVRRTRLIMAVETRAAGEIVCAAEYRRIAGFAAWELRERPASLFRLVYSEVSPGVFRATSGAIDTNYGVVRLERRRDD